MRAKEFVTETKRGKMLDAHASVNPGSSFTPTGFLDVYRATHLIARMPALANDINPYSFITDRPMIVTYTEEERQMVKDAFKAMNIPYQEHVHSKSEEPDGVNNESPVQGFKGY